jgi:hypothetical protein|tara:strand:- start:6688 stop:6843 length:156 start_codon:yes stop_codon:yes gene_type:complete
METIEIKLSKEEMETLLVSGVDSLLPDDGTVETAILRGIVEQINKHIPFGL